jgi:hypothetical protein
MHMQGCYITSRRDVRKPDVANRRANFMGPSSEFWFVRQSTNRILPTIE